MFKSCQHTYVLIKLLGRSTKRDKAYRIGLGWYASMRPNFLSKLVTLVQTLARCGRFPSWMTRDFSHYLENPIFILKSHLHLHMHRFIGAITELMVPNTVEINNYLIRMCKLFYINLSHQHHQREPKETLFSSQIRCDASPAACVKKS